MAIPTRFRENIDGNKLDLSMSGLAEVPVKDIAMIKKATILDLSNNQITLLPASFGLLTHLVELDLSKNMIRELPESFGKLTNLRRLDLYGNELSHLPLGFCHLKALRWLDLKNNPLVPMLAEIAGPCGDMQQCQQCARNIVNALTQAAIKVEEDRKRLLQAKLYEQEQIEQEYLMKKKELEGEGNKKAKKKNKKNKAEKQSHENSVKGKIVTSGRNPEITGNDKGEGTEYLKENQNNHSGKTGGFFSRCLGSILHLAFLVVSTITVLLLCSIVFAAYDSKYFIQTAESLDFIPKGVISFVLYIAKYVEFAAKHPTIREIRSQLAACVRSVLASILNIYKTVSQELPVYYDVVKSKLT